MQIQCVAMRCFRIALQLFTAVSKSKSSNSGPSMLILSKLSRVLVFNRFLKVVLILFIEENARSQSAVVNGMTKHTCEELVSSDEAGSSSLPMFERLADCVEKNEVIRFIVTVLRAHFSTCKKINCTYHQLI